MAVLASLRGVRKRKRGSGIVVSIYTLTAHPEYTLAMYTLNPSSPFPSPKRQGSTELLSFILFLWHVTPQPLSSLSLVCLLSVMQLCKGSQPSSKEEVRAATLAISQDPRTR